MVEIQDMMLKEKHQKGVDCVIEMKFRKTHYDEKMLEKEKYDALMAIRWCCKDSSL